MVTSLTAFDVSVTTSWQMYLLNVVQMCIRPVQLVISVVDRDPIGPLYLCGDDSHFVRSIHSSAAYKGFVSPVCPVHISKKRSKKITLDHLISVYVKKKSLNFSTETYQSSTLYWVRLTDTVIFR